jgi:hypothetical protein
MEKKQQYDAEKSEIDARYTNIRAGDADHFANLRRQLDIMRNSATWNLSGALRYRPAPLPKRPPHRISPTSVNK